MSYMRAQLFCLLGCPWLLKQGLLLFNLLNNRIDEFSVLVSTQIRERGKRGDVGGGPKLGVGSKKMIVKGMSQCAPDLILREEGWQ